MSSFRDRLLDLSGGQKLEKGESFNPITDPVGFLETAFESVGPFFLGLLGVDLPDGPDEIKGSLLNYAGGGRPIPVLYGARRVGGIYAAPPMVSGDNNEYVHLFLIVSEGPIQALGDVYLDGVISTDARFADLVRINKHLGAWAQTADTDAVAELANWTTDHKLAGLAYLYIRLKWDQDAFGKLPVITVDAEGRTLFDPRDDSTAYSNNPALVVRDYLTDTTYGKGLAAARIDDASFESAADYFETVVQDYSGGLVNQPRWRCDGLLDTGRRVLDNLRDLPREFGAELVESDGLYALQVDRDSASVMSLTEDDVFGALEVSDAGRRQRFNRIRVQYASQALDYESYEVIVDSATLLTADNDRVQEGTLSLRYTVRDYQALRAGEQALKQSRQALAVRLLTSSRALALTRGDVIDLTYKPWGLTAKLFRVERLRIMADGLVALDLAEHNASVYDHTVGPERTPPADTTLPNPWSVPNVSALTAESGTDQLLLQADGTIVPRVLVSWTPPAHPYLDHYRVEWRLAGGPAGYNNAVMVGAGENDQAYLSGIPEGVSIFIRVRAVNTLGVQSSGSNFISHTVVGKSAPPADVTGYSVSVVGNSLLHEWLAVADLDVREYEIRQGGSNWDTATLVASVSGTSYTDPNLPTSTTTYRVKAVDTSGNYSTNQATYSRTVAALGAVGALTAAANAAAGSATLSWTAPSSTYEVAEYELREGAVFASAAVIGSVSALTVTLERAAGSYTFWVRAKDVAGRFGTQSSVTVAIKKTAVIEWQHFQKLLPREAGVTSFGASLAMDAGASTMVVGDFDTAVYVYSKRGVLAAVDKIIPSVAGDDFATALTISQDGQIIAATSPGHNTDRGRLFVFTRGADGVFTETQILAPAVMVAGQLFGFDVAISDDGLYLAACSPRASNGATTTEGAVYVYTLSSGSYGGEQIVRPNAAGTGQRWAAFCALSWAGDVLVMGKTPSTTGSNVAEVHTRSGATWSYDGSLSFGGATQGILGVGISGDGKIIALAGFSDADTLQLRIFEDVAGTWTDRGLTLLHTEDMTLNWAGEADRIRVSLSRSGNYILASNGRVNENPSANADGAAWLLERTGNTWGVIRTLAADATQTAFGFYSAIASNGQTLAIGASADDDAGTNAGAAYVYDILGLTA